MSYLLHRFDYTSESFTRKSCASESSPSIMIPLLPKVSRLDEAEGLLSGAALVNLSDVGVNAVLEFLKRGPFTDLYTRTDNSSDAWTVLHAGSRAVVVPESVANSLESEGVPRNRLVLDSFTNSDGYLGCFGTVADAHSLGDKMLVFTEDVLGDAGIPVLFGEEALPEVLTSRLTSDRPDGLWTTVVLDLQDRCLGLCYSSPESVREACAKREGVYQSRKRGLWHKGATSGDTQRLVKVKLDCDSDCLAFNVEQQGSGFCHLKTESCFTENRGLPKLEKTIYQRLADAPEGSYTRRLLMEPGMLEAKIMEEAEELCDADSKHEISWEAADLLYFASVKLAKFGVTWRDVEANLDAKSLKISRRRGDVKPKWEHKQKEATEKSVEPQQGQVAMNLAAADVGISVVKASDEKAIEYALRRPAQSSNAFELSRPIVEDVRKRGDACLVELTEKFDKAKLSSPVLNAPFPPELMEIPDSLRKSIDLAVDNVRKFHAAQLTPALTVETMPGVTCSRFSRPIARVGLYVPGGSAILPSSAIMLGVPAQVAGCKHITIATPPRPDGTPSPEVLYVAHKVGAKQLLLAGGAQAVAAMAYGTQSVQKVDKIFGPGNQFVTAAKMIASTDLSAQVAIDMPAGPSEVLVVADTKARKDFVVSDLLSQAEHGPDSQVILISIAWSAEDLKELAAELDKQTRMLPRADIVRKALSHSCVIEADTREQAMALANQYAPEHLILQCENPDKLVELVDNAGSVFVGPFSPESCGDYTSGTNHTLPTYGYANQYSGVNTDMFLKYLTSQTLTEQGISKLGNATVELARREGLEAHANAVVVRLNALSPSRKL